ncbi:GAF domain-containing protein [Salinibacterium sp. TMP30]|uniref:GAF domain-containing protein n=1 Tax=Salinibacterium sp. TMP30 TaxID=3138237 RepID=UPI003138E89C
MNSQRLLVVGSGPAVGWGVTSHELGLPGALARALSDLTGFGCTVDVIADPSLTPAGVVAAVESVSGDRYDAVVVTVGVNDALSLTPPAEWGMRLREMVAGLKTNFPAESPLFIVGIPPIHSIPLFSARVSAAADTHARRLNQVTLNLTSLEPRTVYLPLLAASAHDYSVKNSRHRTAHEYTRWASQLAHQMVPHLVGGPRDARENGAPAPGDEEKRQHAVDHLYRAALHKDLGLILDRITSMANRAFHTQTALLTVLGPDFQWNLAHSGPNLGEVPRHLSLCDTTIQFGDVLVIPDTLADARFRDNPLVTAGPRIRFYAGFPIESPSGERIGALCVIDTQPRRRRGDINEPLIRELALMAQRELWQHLGDDGSAPA